MMSARRVWSVVPICPRCGHELELKADYYDIPGRNPPLIKRLYLECPYCGYRHYIG